MTSTGLLASSPTIDGIAKLIKQYLYSEDLMLIPATPSTWQIKRTNGEILDSYLVSKKNGRYRFSQKTGGAK